MKKKILLLELDLTDTEDSWVIAIQKAEMDVSGDLDRHVIVKRNEEDHMVHIPMLSDPKNSFVLSATLEIHE